IVIEKVPHFRSSQKRSTFRRTGTPRLRWKTVSPYPFAETGGFAAITLNNSDSRLSKMWIIPKMRILSLPKVFAQGYNCWLRSRLSGFSLDVTGSAHPIHPSTETGLRTLSDD